MKKFEGRFLWVLMLLTLVLAGCGLVRRSESPEVDLPEIFPGDLPTVGEVKRLDVNNDGPSEWLVFYHIDNVQDDVEGSPVAAAVYRPVSETDSRLPPRLVPALVWVPDQGYPCLYDCEAEMRDVISRDSEGRELVVRDEREDEVVGVAIYRWQDTDEPQGGHLVPLGHFRGDAVEIEEDRVTVIRKFHDRSNLGVQEIYRPVAGRYYEEAVQTVDSGPATPRSPEEAEIIFTPGPPEAPAEVKQPEKLVLAFYRDWNDLDQIEGYVTPSAWENVVQGCPANRCGCASRREDVRRVMVKQIAYESDLSQLEIKVVAQVVCVNRGDQSEPITAVTWTLRRRLDRTWRLTNVEPGGDQYLCPRFGCQPLEARE